MVRRGGGDAVLVLELFRLGRLAVVVDAGVVGGGAVLVIGKV